MFLEYRNEGRTVEPFMQIPAAADTTYYTGQALYMNNGVAAAATGTTRPTFICQTGGFDGYTAKTGDLLEVTLVNGEQELEVPLSAAGTSLKVGDSVTIGTDADGRAACAVTATTTGGTFYITKINGTAIGDTVCGMF